MNKPARIVFDRTECACEQCVACCKHMPGYLAFGDLGVLAMGLRVENLADLVPFLQASEGPIVMNQIAGLAYRIPTIVPAMNDRGCVFLQDDRCKVHAHAPFGCGWFDPHMTKDLGDVRSQYALKQILEDFLSGGLYSQMWVHLKEFGKVAPPLAERRKNLAEAGVF